MVRKWCLLTTLAFLLVCGVPVSSAANNCLFPLFILTNAAGHVFQSVHDGCEFHLFLASPCTFSLMFRMKLVALLMTFAFHRTLRAAEPLVKIYLYLEIFRGTECV